MNILKIINKGKLVISSRYKSIKRQKEQASEIITNTIYNTKKNFNHNTSNAFQLTEPFSVI